MYVHGPELIDVLVLTCAVCTSLTCSCFCLRCCWFHPPPAPLPAPPHFVSLVSITDICMGCLLFQVQVYFFSISQPLL